LVGVFVCLYPCRGYLSSLPLTLFNGSALIKAAVVYPLWFNALLSLLAI